MEDATENEGGFKMIYIYNLHKAFLIIFHIKPIDIGLHVYLKKLVYKQCSVYSDQSCDHAFQGQVHNCHWLCCEMAHDYDKPC